MPKRTPTEAGNILRQRREALGRSQDDFESVSSATIRKIENASAESYKRRSLVAYATELGLAGDAYERLLRGEPEERVIPPSLTWSSADGPSSLDRLRNENPDAWAELERMATRLLKEIG
jgi:transcriptional regulator with XRE-family HTH domain